MRHRLSKIVTRTGGAGATGLGDGSRAARMRRASLVTAAATDNITATSRIYLNPLSDPLFVLARVLNRSAGRPDVTWRKDRGG